MGWSGTITKTSAVGANMVYTPDTQTQRGYTIGTFTAPRAGIYRFELYGSGGSSVAVDSGSIGAGGAGGKTTGYLKMSAGQSVYCGAGGALSAAFVSKVSGANLAAIAKGNLYFVAGGGGGGGAQWGASVNYWGGGEGGKGGGASGANGISNMGCPVGSGGTQTSGYQYGTGQNGVYGNNNDTSTSGGSGGDGLYGGTAGASLGDLGAGGGGGGSGYIHASTLTYDGSTYTNTTQQGGGAGSNAKGSIKVTYYVETELPVVFNGVTLEKLFYNETRIKSLIYNGT